MWLIVGLGNPGSKYLLTRHNVGFLALDYLTKAVGVRDVEGKSECKGRTIDFKWDAEPVKLVKPETFMNLSGECVGELMRYYKIDLEHVVVVYDDMDIPLGQIRVKQKSGGGSSHNGIKSLVEHLGTNDFLRVKIGIGRPPHKEMDPANFVLQNFSKTEQESLNATLERAVDALEMIVFDDVTKAMNVFNVKESKDGI
jgi:PTH1 family peptidyl-tRNA hydrolase